MRLRSACRFALRRLLAAGLALAVPASAATLYKSVAPDGSIEFSNVRPEGRTQVVELAPSSDPFPAAPPAAVGVPLDENDPAVIAADERLDLAEHQFALARRSTWTEHDGLHLAAKPRTLADVKRVQYYDRLLSAAHTALIEAIGHHAR
jgi:hypothetical protein